MAFSITGTQYAVDGGLVVLAGATTVEQTGMLPGELYEFVVSGATVVCRWGADDASAADGGFDFAVRRNGETVRAICPTGVTAINVIEADLDSSAAAVLLIARVIFV